MSDAAFSLEVKPEHACKKIFELIEAAPETGAFLVSIARTEHTVRLKYKEPQDLFIEDYEHGTKQRVCYKLDTQGNLLFARSRIEGKDTSWTDAASTPWMLLGLISSGNRIEISAWDKNPLNLIEVSKVSAFIAESLRDVDTVRVRAERLAQHFSEEHTSLKALEMQGFLKPGEPYTEAVYTHPLIARAVLEKFEKDGPQFLSVFFDDEALQDVINRTLKGLRGLQEDVSELRKMDDFSPGTDHRTLLQILEHVDQLGSVAVPDKDAAVYDGAVYFALQNMQQYRDLIGNALATNLITLQEPSGRSPTC